MRPIELAIIVGSVRDGRIAPVVADWAAGTARRRPEFSVRVVDLVDFDLPDTLVPTPDTERFTRIIGEVAAFIVVTPEYNHGVPGGLKTALDSVKVEWRGKAIGFVGYGGLGGGLRAVEQLRQIVAELHMVSVRDAVSIARVRKRFDEQGDIDDAAAVDAIERMLDQIAWWVDGKGSAPYPR